MNAFEIDSWAEWAGTVCHSGRCEEAISVMEQASRRSPNDWSLRYALGMCYAGGYGSHSLLDPDIALDHLRYALSLVGDSSNSLVRAQILDAMGSAYMASRSLPARARIQAAIKTHEQAASIYLDQRRLEDWAREQYNLGNAWCELPNAEFPESWQQAINHYENALQVRTRQSDPEHYASTLQNLGTTYRELPTGDKATNVKKAISCYHRAIQVNRPSASPLHNAALHNNLGNAYLSLPAETASGLRRNVHRALRHFGHALLIRTKEHYPCDYALTQFNQGNGLLRLITVEHEDQRGLEQAVACFREARELFRQCGQLQYAELAEKRLSKALNYLSRSPVAA